MSNQNRTIRLFHRHVNFNSTPAKRKSCVQSLKHSLRISPASESVKQLEWNPDLIGNNLLYQNGKLYNLDKQLNDEQKWKMLFGIAPKPKIKNHTKCQTQHRQYRKKLKDAAKAERKRGNELAAECLERIVEVKGAIKRQHIQDIHQVGFSRYKQRIGAIRKYVIAHNKLCQYPANANSTVVQEGIFKIPHRWNVTSDDIPLREYILTTKTFLETHFPEHPIKAIVGHDDERNEDEKTGLHTHYFLSGQNHRTGEYDLRKRQVDVVNEYLAQKGLESELLPTNKDLTRQQSRAFGHYWQCLVQDFMNAQLLNPKGLHAEFTDETEKKTEQYQYMIRQSKLPKSQRDFNHHTRLLEKLNLEIQVLRDEQVGEANQLDVITQQVDELSECLKDKDAELKQLELQKQQYQQELQEAAHRYIYLEEHSEKKEAELAYTESLLAEKEAQLVEVDAQSKQQMKEIVLDAFMFMQARRRKFPRAEREYAEKIAERLGDDIPSQLAPLLDAVLIESGYHKSPDKSLDEFRF
ncbi:hypothetical protein P6A00_001641 [Vibrio parahaemolyticus]|uniref:hypothetical protein n=1 Tax=Vibrio parahaemolyticus TaxID=670 RepID=UPI001A3043D3|nr:hypothetical protein [Vibrio parahaemolyticus]EGQ7798836.1 hypothetical protein [Vibrio parahaemolyticus]EGQ8110537.1 hypothetical protein [Vibrio parahaemolyticus]EGQ8198420.1 hypothetical protein [Vibrio parahaemolyticus]EGU0149852.1 hypothetical protein [Vibrio parahaemolyticus]EKQ5912416.1 hypothetical protein [Vibrio parahaemolyticus]